MRSLAFLILLTQCVFAPALFAQSLTVETVNFQVQIKDNLGNPINGPTTVQTRVYAAAAGGTPLWSESHNTTATNGVVNLALGSLVPFPSGLFQGGSRYLGVQVATDPEMTPRLEVAAVPVAITAQKVQVLEAAQVNETAIAPNAVTNSKLADAVVTSNKLADLAVGTSKLADLAVVTSKLADAAVGTSKLGDAAVNTTKLADDAVTTPKVCTAAITTPKLADAAVDTAKLDNDSVTTPKVCNTAITTPKLADAAVDTAKLGNDSVTTPKVCAAAITTPKLADLAVDAAKLGDDSVTTPKICTAAITTPKLADFAVDGGKIANSAVDAGKIADGAVSTMKLANLAVDSVKLGDNAVTSGKIASSAVTLDKINSAGAPNGSILTVAGSTLIWGAPVGLLLPYAANVSLPLPQVAFDIRQGDGAAIRGASDGANPEGAVQGEALDTSAGSLGTGVVGKSRGGQGRGVYGEANSANGSGPSYGVHGVTMSLGSGSAGVFGRSPTTDGVVYGVLGVASTVDRGAGVRGEATPIGGVGSSFGVHGISTSTSNDSAAVHGECTAGNGQTRGVLGKVNSAAAYAVYSEGRFAATGTKSFLQPHPTDPALQVRFVCLEGNESGTYFRGSARLVGGRAVIEVPQEFRLSTEPEGLTAQVTAVGQRADLWVESKTLERIVVRGAPDTAFDYFVNGVRRGYARHTAIEPNTAYVPAQRGVPFGTQYPPEILALLVSSGVLNADYTPNEATAARLGWKLRAPKEAHVEEGLQ